MQLTLWDKHEISSFEIANQPRAPSSIRTHRGWYVSHLGPDHRGFFRGCFKRSGAKYFQHCHILSDSSDDAIEVAKQCVDFGLDNPPDFDPLKDKPNMPEPIQTAKFFQISEDDLSELEKISPDIADKLTTLPGYNEDNALRTKLRRLKIILGNVRWNYGPIEEIHREEA